MSTLNVDKVDPSTGTALEIGSSGDTVTIPSGATLTLTSATLNLPTTITSTTEVKTNKISPATGVAFALGDSGDTFTVPSGATIVNSGTATGFGITSASFLPVAQPLIINADMAIAQRGTSSTGISSSSYATCDRWQQQMGGIGEYTITQEALTSGNAFAAGFNNAWRIDCTTADASPGASDYLLLRYDPEGQDIQVFKKGTANAETYTLAFWVKSNKTGVGQVNLRDIDNSRLCSATYTISSGDTWEHKVLNFAADTTGHINDDNTSSVAIEFWLDSGSNYNSGTAPTAWEANADANRDASGALAIADNTANDWAITGVQWEVGTYTSADLPPFRYETYGDNYYRCRRYLQTLAANESSGDLGSGYLCMGQAYTTASIMGVIRYSPVMRSQPSLKVVMGTNYMYSLGGGAEDQSDGFVVYSTQTNKALSWKMDSNVTAAIQGMAASIATSNAAAYIASDAEL